MQQQQNNVSLVELIEQTAAGDESAFEQLHAATSVWFRSICRQFLSDKADVEDAMQNIYVSIWVGAKQFDRDHAEGHGWLATVAQNRAIDRYRRQPGRDEVLPIELASAIEDPGLSPPDFAEGLARGTRLHAQLQRLDGRSRQLIRKSFFVSLSHTQLAASEQLPLGSVKSIIRKGLLQLRSRLAYDLT